MGSIQGLIAQNVIHNLKENSFEVRNFDKRNFSETKNAIYFLSDKDAQSTGRLIVNLNTKEQENIRISWQNASVNKVKALWTARLQYRLSEQEQWNDVKDQNNKSIVYYCQNKRYRQNFSEIRLPKECEDRDFIQVCWLIETKGNKSNDPQILFRNIVIKSDYDKYNGLEAEVRVFINEENVNSDEGKIVFNNIALPYIYPETRRIRIEGERIRDSITLRITGENSGEFSVSKQSVKENQTGGKYIFVNYAPKNEGRHKAFLEISTPKLKQQVIRLALEGSCSKHKDFNKNFIPLSSKESKRYNYHIPVFSKVDYQYSFYVNDDLDARVFVKYTWLRENKELFSMNDTLKSSYYCVPLKSPEGADALEIELSSAKEFLIDRAYFGLPRVKIMTESGLWSNDKNWKDNDAPTMEDFVLIAKNVRAEVDVDVVCSALILEDSANIVINNNKIFYVASDIFYNQKSFFTVYQYLLPERWNYISSPVNQAHAAMFSMKNDRNEAWFMQYNTGVKSKLDDYWSDYITDPKFALIPGKGYAVYTHEPLNAKYEGLLCASSVPVSLKSTPDDKWNLVGNPYTAPLSSKKLFEELDGKIQGNVIMLFDRENRVYNPLIVDSKEEIAIPSLESFFVEAFSYPTDILFKRSQQYIPLYEEKIQTNHNYLNLSVSKNKTYQYALLGMEDKSEFGFDEYDCHKMFGNNENMPEIYLKDAENEYSVNVFPSYPASIDIGLYIGNEDNVEINLNNLSVLPENILVFIEDKEEKRFYNFCEDASVKTYLKSGTTEKYKIHIIKATEIPTQGNSEFIYLWTDAGRLLVYAETDNLKTVKIKNNPKENELEYTMKEVMTLNLKKGKYDVELNINDWLTKKGIEIK
ncbi:MAG: hypothetical protein IJ748_03385 [Bacteroidales bacterium]|nr:hypothetical protein [Bacteroidales bacterium]